VECCSRFSYRLTDCYQDFYDDDTSDRVSIQLDASASLEKNMCQMCLSAGCICFYEE